MDARDAARTWVQTWARAWPAREVEHIVALYADGALYRSLVFAEPGVGPAGARGYLTRVFGEESEIECAFDEPVVDGDRAAVQWWASWVEDGAPVTLAGTTMLRFDADGQVTDHRDYWNQVEGRRSPWPGWQP